MLKIKNTRSPSSIVDNFNIRSTSSRIIVALTLLTFVIIAGCGKDKNSTGSEPEELSGYFVSSTGDDSNPGTPDLPLRTVQPAIDYAAQQGVPITVHVAAGNYSLTKPLELKDRISLRGGYNTVTWERNLASYKTILRGAADSLVIRGSQADSLRVDGFVIVGGDATDVGANSSGKNAIAVALDSCLAVIFSNDSVVVGNASTGGDGDNGSNGYGGGGGGSGDDGGICPNDGGYGSNYYVWGGDGGNGGAAGGFSGGGGSGPAGGSGGSGGSLASDGSNGSNGGSGSAGANGDGGISFGPLAGIIYSPSNGANGTNGSSGSGGGGGGGGGGSIVGLCGAGGGGGGGGGSYGFGGRGGGGGGASIGFIIANYADVNIDSTVINTGNGGDGGAGGARGTGAAGGSGGSGGASGFGTGAGGDGGHGGSGGNGGIGGGGGGGAVIGILEDVNSQTDRVDNVIMLGDPGVGGASTGNSGADGTQEEYLKLTE